MQAVKSMDVLLDERSKLQKSLARTRLENIGPRTMIPEVAKAALDQLIIDLAKVSYEVTRRMWNVGHGPDGSVVFQQGAFFMTECELAEDEIPF